MSGLLDETRRGLYCRYGCDDEAGRAWRALPTRDTVAALQLAAKERDEHEVKCHGEVFIKPKPLVPHRIGGFAIRPRPKRPI